MLDLGAGSEPALGPLRTRSSSDTGPRRCRRCDLEMLTVARDAGHDRDAALVLADALRLPLADGSCGAGLRGRHHPPPPRARPGPHRAAASHRGDQLASPSSIRSDAPHSPPGTAAPCPTRTSWTGATSSPCSDGAAGCWPASTTATTATWPSPSEPDRPCGSPARRRLLTHRARC